MDVVRCRWLFAHVVPLIYSHPNALCIFPSVFISIMVRAWDLRWSNHTSIHLIPLQSVLSTIMIILDIRCCCRYSHTDLPSYGYTVLTCGDFKY